MSFRDRSGERRAPSSEPDWLTLGQAAKYLGVAQSTIRKWSDLGRVPAFYTPGGHRRFRRRDLDSFLESSGPHVAQRGPLVLIVDDDDRGCTGLPREAVRPRPAHRADEAAPPALSARDRPRPAARALARRPPDRGARPDLRGAVVARVERRH